MAIGIGLAGTGEVGKAVAAILREKRELLRRRCGFELEIVKASYRSKRPPAELGLDGVLTTDFLEVVDDPKVQVVVELMGGVGDAVTVIERALSAGKCVVTANKAALAAHGTRIFAAAQKSGAALGFEAAVAGAVPIISSLRNSFVAESFQSFYGILNGTTNYILTRMQEGMSWDDALRLAQQKGFAEAEPSLDVSGADAAQKLALLASLLFNTAIPGEIHSEGITSITGNDMLFAADLGYVIKLLAIARRRSDGLELSVRPTLIPARHELANIKNEYNALFLKGDNIGQSMFYGLGAGARPTASMVISDIVRIARNVQRKHYGFPLHLSFDEIPLVPFAAHRSPFYLRFGVLDRVGILARIASILASHGVSLAGAWSKKTTGDIISLVVATHEAPSGDVCNALREIDATEGLVSGASIALPIDEMNGKALL